MQRPFTSRAIAPLPRLAALAAAAGLGIALAGCHGTVEVASEWRDREVVIDGQNTEWAGALTDFPKANVSVGAMNDDQFLYLSLFLGDERVRKQALLHGFTLWFDAEGGTDPRGGLGYPVGLDPEERKNFGPGSPHDTPVPIGDEVEILGPDKNDRARIPIQLASGLSVIARPYPDVLVYELKIPLADTDDRVLAVGAVPGQQIGVGLSIGAPDPEDMPTRGRERSARSRGGEGGRSGGGGMRGGRGGGPGGGGRRPEPPGPLEVWAKVTLAAHSSG